VLVDEHDGIRHLLERFYENVDCIGSRHVVARFVARLIARFVARFMAGIAVPRAAASPLARCAVREASIAQASPEDYRPSGMCQAEPTQRRRLVRPRRRSVRCALNAA
jgi:hypothetical protein